MMVWLILLPLSNNKCCPSVTFLNKRVHVYCITVWVFYTKTFRSCSITLKTKTFKTKHNRDYLQIARINVIILLCLQKITKAYGIECNTFPNLILSRRLRSISLSNVLNTSPQRSEAYGTKWNRFGAQPCFTRCQTE